MPKLTKVEPIGPRRERLALYFDDILAGDVHADAFLLSGLAVGDAVTHAAWAALQHDDALHSARAAALNLLSYRARSEVELRRRLLQKGFAADIVTIVVQALA